MLEFLLTGKNILLVTAAVIGSINFLSWYYYVSKQKPEILKKMGEPVGDWLAVWKSVEFKWIRYFFNFNEKNLRILIHKIIYVVAFLLLIAWAMLVFSPLFT